MHRTIVLIGLLALAATAVVAQDASAAKPATTKTKTATAAGSDADQIMAIEKSLDEAWKNHDSSVFQKVVADDGMDIEGNGVNDKAAVVKMASATDCSVQSVNPENMKVKMLGASVAVLTYKVSADGTCGGRPIPTAYATTVYQKRAGRWTPVVHQETPVSQ